MRGQIFPSPIPGVGSNGLYPTLTPPVGTNFAWINQLGSTEKDYSNRAEFSLPSNGVDPNWRLFKQLAALPAPPYTALAAFDFPSFDGNYYEISLSLLDSVSGKFVDLNINIPGATPQIRLLKFNSVTVVSSATTLVSFPRGLLVFLKITDDGATRIYSFSSNGWTFPPIATEASGTFVTPTHACIGCANFSGAVRLFQCFHWQVANSIL